MDIATSNGQLCLRKVNADMIMGSSTRIQHMVAPTDSSNMTNALIFLQLQDVLVTRECFQRHLTSVKCMHARHVLRLLRVKWPSQTHNPPPTTWNKYTRCKSIHQSQKSSSECSTCPIPDRFPKRNFRRTSLNWGNFPCYRKQNSTSVQLKFMLFLKYGISSTFQARQRQVQALLCSLSPEEHS